MQSEDDAPFNFQGMLRKTKYQRESMKRTKEQEYKANIDNGDATVFEQNYSTASRRSSRPDLFQDYSLSPTNIVYQSGRRENKDRSASSQGFYDPQCEVGNGNGSNDENENHSGRLSAPMYRQRRTSLPPPLKKHDLNLNVDCGTYIHEEIRPGVILEGYALEI